MMRVKMAIIALVVAAVAVAQTTGGDMMQQQVAPTRYDYTQVTRQITEGCSSKYEQAYAIYRWLCDNISYDTSYSIYTADECWDNRRGVCQAYSELFYRLAEPLGLETHIVRGDAKGPGGIEGHAWVFVIVEGTGTGILVDPTWGAGSVNGSTFTHREDDDSWFHVDPYWMIFTHFPDEASYQFLPQPLSRSQFDALPEIKPFWGKYGFNAKEIFDRCMAGNDDFPKIYISGMDKLGLADVPMERTLRVGERYRFAVQKLQQCDLALIDNAFHGDWQQSGDIYYMEYMPTVGGKLHLGFKQGSGRSYSTVVEYEVAQPTAADLARLEAANPMLMPEITGLDGFDAAALQKYGIDGGELLAAVRRGEVVGLPTFYDSAGDCVIDEMPLNGMLRLGQSYTFTLRPRNGVKWAIINEGSWNRTWNIDQSTGAMSMTVTPMNAGKLVLAVQMKQGGTYEYCISFNVK